MTKESTAVRPNGWNSKDIISDLDPLSYISENWPNETEQDVRAWQYIWNNRRRSIDQIGFVVIQCQEKDLPVLRIRSTPCRVQSNGVCNYSIPVDASVPSGILKLIYPELNNLSTKTNYMPQILGINVLPFIPNSSLTINCPILLFFLLFLSFSFVFSLHFFFHLSAWGGGLMNACQFYNSS